MKKIISCFIATIILASFASFNAFASTYFQYDSFVFESYSDSTCSIVDYVGTNKNLIVPESLIGDKVTSIAFGAFMDNTTVETVTLPKTLTSLGDSAFNRAYNLVSVNIPENCTSIGKLTFQNCTSLKNVKFESDMTSISAQMFLGCISLEEITLPLSVEKIGKYAFRDCTALKKIVIPRATTYIDPTAFRNCTGFTIYGYWGSYVQQFAAENNIPFEPVSDFMLGDVDMDGDITISDVTTIQKSLVDVLAFTEEQEYLADVDKNGTVSIDDATTIQKYLAEVISSFE